MGRLMGHVPPGLLDHLAIDPQAQGAASRKRGPLFIWSNPSMDDLIAGRNAGMQIWIGDNPTATPGAGDAVGLTLACINGNGRGPIWGQNIVVGRSQSGEGYEDAYSVGLEVNMYNDFSLGETNPYGPGIGRKNMLELVASLGGDRLTAAGMVWAADDTGTSWFEHGIHFSRCVQTGIKFVKNAASPDRIKAFQVASIYDASDSQTVVKVDGAHTHGIDMSGAAFDGLAFQSRNFSIDAHGNLRALSLTLNGRLVAVDGNGFLKVV